MNKEPGIRVILAAITVFLCICVLASCGQKTQSLQKQNSANITLQEQSDNVLVREDSEGLVQVRIENGDAVIWFDYDKWDSLYGVYAFMDEFNLAVKNPDNPYRRGTSAHSSFGGGFPITGLSGRVADACIGKIEALDLLNYQDFVSLSVFLLMEDGSLEWFYADPLAPAIVESFDAYESMGPLPWMDGIKSLSYEPDNEGIGEMTVYAEDVEGRRFDLRIPWHFKNFFAGTWTCDLLTPDNTWLNSYLRFNPDGKVTFYIAPSVESHDVILAGYSGSFYITLAENEDIRPGLIFFDMEADGWNPRPKIKGSYFAEVDYGGNLNLWISDGDFLYETMDSYNFGMLYDSDAEG